MEKYLPRVWYICESRIGIYYSWMNVLRGTIGSNERAPIHHSACPALGLGITHANLNMNTQTYTNTNPITTTTTTTTITAAASAAATATKPAS